MSPAEWAAFVAAILSCCGLIIAGLRYIIRHEVPGIIEGSNIVQRIEKQSTEMKTGYVLGSKEEYSQRNEDGIGIRAAKRKTVNRNEDGIGIRAAKSKTVNRNEDG